MASVNFNILLLSYEIFDFGTILKTDFSFAGFRLQITVKSSTNTKVSISVITLK